MTGRLGVITVQGDTPVQGEPLLFTKDNIDPFSF